LDGSKNRMTLMRTSTKRQQAGTARYVNRVGRMAAEIPAATLTTLAFRLPMLWQAMSDPKAAADPELRRMVSEKIHAAERSARAVALGGKSAAGALNRHGAKQLQSMAPVKAALASTDPGTALTALWRQGMLNAEMTAALASEMAGIGARTLSVALAPLHGRVTANARRLSTRKTKSTP
jgi:hypothetical protein